MNLTNMGAGLIHYIAPFYKNLNRMFHYLLEWKHFPHGKYVKNPVQNYYITVQSLITKMTNGCRFQSEWDGV